MSKLHYRRIKKYLRFWIVVDLALILFFMALPAGLLIWAVISANPDSTATITVSILIINLYRYCVLHCGRAVI